MLLSAFVAALLVQYSLCSPVPNDCNDLCNNQQMTQDSFQRAEGSFSSAYKASGSFNSEHHVSGSSSGRTGNLGLGSRGSRLETFDENTAIDSNSNNNNNNNNVQTVNQPGQSLPDNWQDEKHYVTNDGKGELNYRAGQTRTGNGYTKFVQHSYRYSSSGSQAPQANAEVLSTEDFNRKLQSLPGTVRGLMGQFESADTIEKFMALYDKNIGPIKGQLQNISEHTNVANSMHQRAVSMMRELDNLVEQKFKDCSFNFNYKDPVNPSQQQHQQPAF